ncbi:MAG: exopolysaccharide biosynthesis protein [Actinomycetota bacterium]|nr:exopolysaccharide biosynthesis protein [Actinomycetota bacterium]
MTAEREFSDDLEDWLRGDTPKTLGDLGDAFKEKSFAVTILLLMFLPALPLPTGGITHVFEVITIFVALQMVLGRRTIWLPRRWKQRALGATITGKAVPFIIRRVRWFEKFSRPRLAQLFRQREFIRIVGLIIIGLTAGAAIAPPFSGLDTLPALGVVIISLAIILEDALVLGIGVLIGTGGVVLIVTIGAALARVIRDRF